jgi:hypothetical protein
MTGALTGCGGSSGTDNPGGDPGEHIVPPPAPTTTATPDAGPPPPPPPPPVDHGTPSTTYPAFKPDVPQLQDNGSGGLKNPVIVTVTWPNDPNADHFERFGDEIGETQYWKDVTEEYGVGPAKSGAANHVRMTTPFPASVTEGTLDAIVRANVTGTTVKGQVPDATKWPAYTAETIYILYLPPDGKLMIQTEQGQQEVCSSNIGGYHSITYSSVRAAYAIIPPCAYHNTAKEDATISASHELAEAATDARPGSGWQGVDNDHIGWDLFQSQQDENGDLCEFYRDTEYKETGDTTGTFDFFVQRQWSNKSAAAGHNPCVPVPKEPYFNTTLLAPEKVTVDLSALGGSKSFKTTGVQIPVGQTKTIDVGFFSDGPTEPWNIGWLEDGPLDARDPSHTNHLTVSIDKVTGVNGEKAHVSVKVDSAGAGKKEVLVIASSKGSTDCYKDKTAVCHMMPILISSP